MESMLLLEDGASVAQVDKAMVNLGLPMGPLQMADLSGLDVGFRIRQQQGLVDDTIRSPGVRYSAIGDELYRAGMLGQKNGRGFYRYTSAEKGKPAVPVSNDPDVEAIIQKERHRKGIMTTVELSVGSGLYSGTTGGSTMTPAEILQRLLFSLMNEGFRLLGEGGVVSNRPGDIDIIYCYGYGWPAYAGGPMYYADVIIGLSALLSHLESLSDRFPESPWFKPAPLLVEMVKQGVSIFDVQRTPGLVDIMLRGAVKSRL